MFAMCFVLGSMGDDIDSGLETCSVSLLSNGMKVWTPLCPVDKNPYVGLTFNNMECAVNFYKEYARFCGFSVRMGTDYKNPEGVKTIKYMLCSRQGVNLRKKVTDSLVVPASKIKQRSSNRCYCEAKIQLNLVAGGMWRVYRFEPRHNHELVSEVGKQFLRINRSLTFAHKSLIVDLSSAGVGPQRAHRVMKQMCGGYGNVGATVVDFKNFKRDLKVFISGCDAQMLVDTFRKKRDYGTGFTFEFTEDREGTLTKLFWADRVSRMDCSLFADVVSFDATYSSNK